MGSAAAAEIVNGTPVAGLVQPPPYAAQLRLVRTLAPTAERLLVPHFAAPPAGLARAANEFGLNVVPIPLADGDDIPTVLGARVTDSDVLFLSADPGIEAAVELLVDMAVEHRLPVVASSEDAVSRGAVAAIDYDPYDVGRQTGAQVLSILEGRTAGELGISEARPTKLVLNEDTAQRMNLVLPRELVNQASFVVEGPFDRPRTQGSPVPVPPPCEGTARCE